MIATPGSVLAPGRFSRSESKRSTNSYWKSAAGSVVNANRFPEL